MFAIQNQRTGKFVYSTNYRYNPPHQLTSDSRKILYKTQEEASYDFEVVRKCGKNYRIVEVN